MYEITEKNFKETPKEILLAIKDYYKEKYNKNYKISDYDELFEIISESSSRSIDRTVDSCYITTNYVIDFGNYTFEISGSEYIKDGGTCPFEWDEGIYVTDIKAKKEKEDNMKKWSTFFEGKTLNEAYEILKNTSFPL